jgi:predicted dehydrogenase
LRLFSYGPSGQPTDRTGAIKADDEDLTPAWMNSVPDFVNAMICGGPPQATGEDALRVAELIDQAYQKGNRSVAINSENRGARLAQE